MKEEKQQLFIISLIVFIGFIGTSMAYPIFPPLFLHPSQDSIIPMAWSDTTRSILLGIALAAYPFGQFIGSPILGGCSDRYGRKRVLILNLIGSTFGYLLSALALTFNCLWLLLLSRFFTGIMEGNLAIARAMAADLESMSKYKSMGRINTAASIGYITGPLFGGFLSDKNIIPFVSFAFPFYLAMAFLAVGILLASLKLREKKLTYVPANISIWQRFNLIARFKFLFKNSITLKYLLIISTIFTFSVDIFYEFGPVYLTKLWFMTPANIALYNGIVCLALAIGNGLPHYLSRYFSVTQVILFTMLITSVLFALMILFPTPFLAFILFGLVGLTIAIVNTNIVIQVSDSVDKSIQGEVLGTQLSLRTLGDALICLLGGFLIISSAMLPLALSCLIAFIAVSIYAIKFYGNKKLIPQL